MTAILPSRKGRPSACSVLVLFLLGGAWMFASRASAQRGKPLACAVVGTGSTERSEALCDALGEALGRRTVLVDDGSNVRRGDSLHIVQGDVVWTVIWLRDGNPRAFTRVSNVDAAGQEALFLARASRALRREADKTKQGCLRVEPNGGRPMRAPELAYPWVTLKRCRERVVDVIDPWWSAPRG